MRDRPQEATGGWITTEKQMETARRRQEAGRWRDRAVVRYRCVAGLLGTCIALINASASSQVVSGDTLILNGTLYRLWGIDAPERNQYCSDGWPAGSLAKARLQSLVDGRTVHCEERERDIYGQSVAVCTASGTDLAAKLVREGFAWLSRQHAQDTLTRRRGRKRKA